MLKGTKILLALGTSLLVLMGCASDTATHHELCYIVKGDQIEEIAQENLVFGDEGIQVIVGADTVALDGSLLTVSSTTVESTEGAETFVTYALVDKDEETIAEARIDGVESGGFRKIVLIGDYGRIPRDLPQAVEVVAGFVQRDLNDLRNRGAKSVTEVNSGEEVVEAK
jgi:hypothetical protein